MMVSVNSTICWYCRRQVLDSREDLPEWRLGDLVFALAKFCYLTERISA